MQFINISLCKISESLHLYNKYTLIKGNMKALFLSSLQFISTLLIKVIKILIFFSYPYLNYQRVFVVLLLLFFLGSFAYIYMILHYIIIFSNYGKIFSERLILWLALSMAVSKIACFIEGSSLFKIVSEFSIRSSCIGDLSAVSSGSIDNSGVYFSYFIKTDFFTLWQFGRL